jgi:hypothetical protein
MSLRPGQIFWIKDLSKEYGHEIWNVERKEYRVGSLMTVSWEMSRDRLDLVGVQEVRWEGSGMAPAGEYTFFYGKRNENHELGKGVFCT